MKEFKIGDEIYDESVGTLYRVISERNEGGAYFCEYSDEYDEKEQDYVNFRKSWVSENDLKRKARNDNN